MIRNCWPGEQVCALGLVRGELGGTLELGSCLHETAELGQQVAAHARQQVVVAQRGNVEQCAGYREPGWPVEIRVTVELDDDINGHTWAYAAVPFGSGARSRCITGG